MQNRILETADSTTRPESLEAYIPVPSNRSSTRILKSCLFSGDTSGLDAFSLYHLVRSCPALPCQTTGRPEAPTARSSRTGATFPSDNNTIPLDSNQPVSRRSKPSSRSPLMGEQPHPWVLLHTQDGKNRHRSSKPQGRYGLLPATTQLSPR